MNVSAKFNEVDEEFTNFMYRVNEVSSIINKLKSTDKDVQELGTLEADKYLNQRAETLLEKIDEKDVVLNVKSDRTVLNKKALNAKDDRDQNKMSQEAFMNEISKDADQRYKDKLVRTEKMETFKRQATLAFRRNDYERALSCYNKAIEQIRDSPLLYNNRCLTLLHLKMYDKAAQDAETALKLNENCLKSYLFLAKAYLFNNQMSSYKWAVKEAHQRHPHQKEFIDDFIAKISSEKEKNNQ